MHARGKAALAWVGGVAAVLGLILLLLAFVYRGGVLDLPTIYLLLFPLVGACGIYVAWYVDPAWLLTAGVVLTPFNGHWDAFALPQFITPDRYLLVIGAAALLLRAPSVRDRPRIRVTPLHWLLGATLAYAVASAMAAGTLTRSEAYFGLVDRMAVPFAIFLLAPAAFHTVAQRRILLGGLVSFGGYLGLTSVFETVGPGALVFPQFILDPAFGIHEGRARGPFLEAAVNGFGLYAGAVAAAIGALTWSGRRARVAAWVVVTLCALGVLFTLTRSAWLAAVAGTLVAMLVVRDLRRFVVPAAIAGAALVLAMFAVIPGFQDDADDRATADRSVWARENLNAAALAMVAERPLTGFGWNEFNAHNRDYFQVLEDTPTVVSGQRAIHNVFLAFASELGLVGVTLYLLSFLFVIATAILRRGPPELLPWRVGLLGISIAWLIIASFVPLGQVFPNLFPWLWAGVVLGASWQLDEKRSAPRLRTPTVERRPSTDLSYST